MTTDHTPCQIVDVPGVGPMRVQGNLTTETDRHYFAELVQAAQRRMTEDLKAEGRAELLDRLTALRQTWADRQRAEIYTRETADGPSAGLASARADLYGQLIADLDQVMSRG
ncbi:hypothetical protein [Nonomuraea sediminis]|uniref:hypothetical protein n=1 Tax=Nonomuraea sediminis TaxID=2835864 RepID=UPI001BDD22BA|nr:hypothetical protein [Nonomuraea sediminis]